MRHTSSLRALGLLVGTFSVMGVLAAWGLSGDSGRACAAEAKALPAAKDAAAKTAAIQDAGAATAASVPVAGKSTPANVAMAYQLARDSKAEYEAFAAKADVEGYKAVAALFRAAAESETIQLAKREALLKELKLPVTGAAAKPVVGSTTANIAKTIANKTALDETFYPAVVKQAELDKNQAVAMFCKGSMAANGAYITFLNDASKNLASWKAAGKEFFVCTVCSFVMTTPEPENCPICKAPKKMFVSFK